MCAPQLGQLPTSNDLFKKRAEKPSVSERKRPAAAPDTALASTSAGPVKRLRLADDESGEAADEVVFQDAAMTTTGGGGASGGSDAAAADGGSSGDSGGGRVAVTQVAKSASRIALYMMRENEPGAKASDKLGKLIIYNASLLD